MKVECPRANTHRKGSAPRWVATGEFNSNRRGLRRAVLRCLVPGCGFYWSSGLPEAIEQAEALSSDPETAPSAVCPVPVPQPSLPMQVPRKPSFHTPKKWADDFKVRQSGEME